MSVDQRKVIDAIGTEKTTGDIVLTIADRLDWSDVRSHLHVLQNKINDYLDFIESGQISESYPTSVGKRIRIDIYFREDPRSQDAVRFLADTQNLLESVGVGFRCVQNGTAEQGAVGNEGHRGAD